MSQHWTQGDFEVCERMARYWSVEQLAEHTGKPEHEIIELFPEVLDEKESLDPPTAINQYKLVDDDEVEMVKKLQHQPDNYAAEVLGRSRNAIQRIRLRNGIKKRGPIIPLTDVEKQYITKRWAEGAPNTTIALELGRGESCVRRHVNSFRTRPS